jgi:hypothetical protein
VPLTAQARRLLHQRSPRQPPCLRSRPVIRTSCEPFPASACSPAAIASAARSGLVGRPPCASGAPRQRLTPDSRVSRTPAGRSSGRAPGRSPVSRAPPPAAAVSPSGAHRVPAGRSVIAAVASTDRPGSRCVASAAVPPVAAVASSVRALRAGPDRWSFPSRWSSFIGGLALQRCGMSSRLGRAAQPQSVPRAPTSPRGRITVARPRCVLCRKLLAFCCKRPSRNVKRSRVATEPPLATPPRRCKLAAAAPRTPS